MTTTHWYYYGEYPIGQGDSKIIRTACGEWVKVKTEIDLQNPSCETCKISKDEYENLPIPD